MINEHAVDVIHGVAFAAFWMLLVVGVVSVLARVAFYRAKGYRMPRLLTRDVVFMVGFALSFGLILIVRVLPNDVRTALQLNDNVPWALATDIPAIVAVLVFVRFELFVIERGDPDNPEIRDLRGRDAIDALEEDDEETLPPGVPRV